MKYVIRGYYGAGNVGDDALIYAILENINIVDPQAEFKIFSKKEILVPSTIKEDRVSFINIGLKNFINVIKKSDVLLFGGGGQFQNVSKSIFSKGLAKQLLLVLITKLYRKKVILFSVSFGPLENKLDVLMLKLLLVFADEINVRDNESKLMSERLLKKTKVGVSFDIASTLENENKKSFLKKVKKKNDKKVIGISVMPVNKIKYKDYNKDLEFLDNFSEILKKVNKNKVKFKIIVFHDGDIRGDYSFSKKLEELLVSFDFEVEFIGYLSNPNEVLKEVHSCDAFIGTRLHSLEFSFASNIPFLGLSYHPKIYGFNEYINGNDENIISYYENFTKSKISEKIISFIENPTLNYDPKIIDEIKNDQKNEVLRLFIKEEL